MMSSASGNRSAHGAIAPGWKLVNDRWLWWDGRQYSAEWDGSQVIPLPIHYWRHGEPFVASRSDGSSWTSDRVPTPPADPVARLLAWVAIAAGAVALVWMAWAAEETECQPGPTKTSSYVEPGSVVVPWLAFAGVAVLLVALWKSLAPDVSWIKGWAWAAVIVAVVVFPVGPMFWISTINCGL